MASLSDSVKLLEDFLNERSKESSTLVSVDKTNSLVSPTGKALNTMESLTVGNALNVAAQNPIVNMGIDTLNQAVTSVVQNMIRQVVDKVDLSPIAQATQSVFQYVVMASTLQEEFAMELARNTARNIVRLATEKKAIIAQMQTEITAIHNACIILLNSQPFFSQYVADLAKAYGLLTSAQNKFDDVLRGMLPAKDPSILRAPVYRKKVFEGGIADLTAARDLILPPNDADITSVRELEDFASSVMDRKTNKEALAAALSIPGMSLKLGLLMLDYTSKTMEINLLLNTFIDALDGYIESLNKASSMYATAYDHIAAGRSQLVTLREDMRATLLMDMEVTARNLEYAKANYPPRVSAAAITWGPRATAILEWMKLNPTGKALDALQGSITSVDAYTTAKTKIQALKNRDYIGGTLPVDQGREKSEEATVLVTRLMILTNSIVARQNSAADVSARFRQVTNHLNAASDLCSNLISILNPFISTKSQLAGPAQDAVRSILNIANQYGLDRVAGIIADGRVRDLFGVTPDTATFAGTAVVSINSIVTALKENPGTTDNQVAALENLGDKARRAKTTQEIEASRSSSATLDKAVAQTQAKEEDDKKTVETAKAAAQQMDAEGATSPLDFATSEISKTIPNFNANKLLTKVL